MPKAVQHQDVTYIMGERNVESKVSDTKKKYAIDQTNRC